MPRIIETGLRKPPAPHAWAVEAYGIVHSVHVPIRPDGSIVYQQFFRAPYPVRACIAVSGLPTPGTVIELIATTALPN